MNGCSASGSSKILLLLVTVLAWPASAYGQWLPTGTGLGGAVVALGSDSLSVYAGNTQGKVWRRPLSELVTQVRTGRPDPRALPGGQLHNFPNPCNATTVFGMSLDRGSEGSVRLYDMLGRCVLTLFEGHIAAGEQSWTADLSALPSGIYFGMVRAATATATCRVVLIR